MEEGHDDPELPAYIKFNLWGTAPKEAISVNKTSATYTQMGLALRSLKSINADFINQILYFSVK